MSVPPLSLSYPLRGGTAVPMHASGDSPPQKQSHELPVQKSLTSPTTLARGLGRALGTRAAPEQLFAAETCGPRPISPSLSPQGILALMLTKSGVAAVAQMWSARLVGALSGEQGVAVMAVDASAV